LINNIESIRKKIFFLYLNGLDFSSPFLTNFLLENVYQSSKIYGCDFSFEEVKNFTLTGETTSEKEFFDYVVIQNIYNAEIWFYNQFDSSFELSLQTIIELNNKILQGIEFRVKNKHDFMVKTKITKGDIRKEPLDLVKDNTIEIEENYLSLKTKMQNMLTKFHYTQKPNLEQIARFFGTFLKIHPFDMGNGRTLRILINYFFMKSNDPLLSFDYDDKNIFQ
jgi:Fic family protein